jgi:hypothetical protein
LILKRKKKEEKKRKEKGKGMRRRDIYVVESGLYGDRCVEVLHRPRTLTLRCFGLFVVFTITWRISRPIDGLPLSR